MVLNQRFWSRAKHDKIPLIISLVAIAGLSLFQNQAYGAEGLFDPESSCTRFFIHKGQTLPLDSGRKQDGDGLRPLLNDHPDSLKHLEAYQDGLKLPTWLAYTGSFGVATIIAGYVAAPNLHDTRVGQRNYRYAFVGTGILIAAGSYAFGQIKRLGNEKNLEKAISTFNNSVPPEQRIRMGFEVDPNGNQGQVTTEVKF